VVADRRVLIAVLLALVAVLGVATPASGQAPGGVSEAASSATPTPRKVDLQLRLGDVKVHHTSHGDTLYVPTDDGTVELSPEEFSYELSRSHREMESSGFLYRLFNITKPWSFAWIAIGFAGQALFTFRMVLQWYVSEKEKRSIIPVAFWWGSLFGGILLCVYFIWRKDIVGVVGQSTGIFVYVRNLALIYRRAADAA
jgi:lipid-A-disaccharide synthase-like uncharacterized protein